MIHSSSYSCSRILPPWVGMSHITIARELLCCVLRAARKGHLMALSRGAGFALGGWGFVFFLFYRKAAPVADPMTHTDRGRRATFHRCEIDFHSIVSLTGLSLSVGRLTFKFNILQSSDRSSVRTRLTKPGGLPHDGRITITHH